MLMLLLALSLSGLIASSGFTRSSLGGSIFPNRDIQAEVLFHFFFVAVVVVDDDDDDDEVDQYYPSQSKLVTLPLLFIMSSMIKI